MRDGMMMRGLENRVAQRDPEPERFLRCVRPFNIPKDYRLGYTTEHRLYPVDLVVNKSDRWAADEYRLDIQENRVLMVVEEATGLPVKFYNDDAWGAIEHWDSDRNLVTKLLLLTQEEIDRWDPVNGRVADLTTEEEA